MRIEDVRIFDGVETVARGSVEVADGRVTRLERLPDEGPPPTRTLLPGLVDAHTHVFLTASNLKLALLFGVTTELDMFAFPPWLTRTLCDTANDRDDVADLRSAGVAVGAKGGFATRVVPFLPSLRGPEKAADFVAARQAEGSHYIKVVLDDGAHHGASVSVLSPEEVAAVAGAAAERGLVTVAHISDLADLRLAFESGITMVTHIPLEETVDAGLAAGYAGGRRAVIPTLTMMEMSVAPERGRAIAADPDLAAFLPKSARTAIEKGNTGLYAEPEHLGPTADLGRGLENVGTLHRAGVPVLAGTDCNNSPGRRVPVVHGVSMHRELELLVQAGLTPAEALTAATAAPARHFGLADRGRIAPGMRADLLLVDGDPTADITRTRAIAGIWKRGVPFDREATLKELS